MTRRPQQIPNNVRCPTCGNSFDVESNSVMPFCSVHCQQIDLGRWFDERIGLPVEPDDEEWEEHDGDQGLPC